MTVYLKLAALSVLGVAALSGAVLATAADYRFEPVAADVRRGAGSDIGVRLIHVPTGKPVANAIIFRNRLDMSPDNMEAMTTTVEPADESEPGVYRFRADFTMAGRWALKLMAKVPGEPETVQGTVTFKAKE